MQKSETAAGVCQMLRYRGHAWYQHRVGPAGSWHHITEVAVLGEVLVRWRVM